MKCEIYEIYDQKTINFYSSIAPFGFSAWAISGLLNGEIDYSICMFLTGLYIFSAKKSLLLQRNKILEEAPDGVVINRDIIFQNKEFKKNLVTFSGLAGLLNSGFFLKNENIAAAVIYGSLMSILLYCTSKSEMGASKTFKVKL